MYNKISLSNIFIGISLIFTILAMLFPDLYIFGMNTYYLDQGKYHIYLLQFFSGVFLHGGIFHFVSNSIFIFIFGNLVETILGRKKYIFFFVFSVFFTGLALTFFSSGNTVGISGFCMALLAYYTLELKSLKDPEYKGGITAMIVNIGIGFYPGISLMGHLFGCISGVIFYYLMKEYMRKRMVGIREV